ncbi:magnesium and cobalt transport protein CorA [Streptomyces sp. NBC_01728]|uniref:magnesium and cobalt transport protein CorA n=1 Tax=unclassified Streptomyces TaxID=2593676 RepID=UPI00225B70D6|nr:MULTISPECIES: magnesium and cobalt transport protein CorA [unclassified Streptomyces]MCX4455315.1 magnesium and cobalt transport protein CorA [Streptomyces sp. NBC_01719]MCX4494675.1 magnesium and cobalt transport protein CorA [Streptomyces sp. NBC_01728]
MTASSTPSTPPPRPNPDSVVDCALYEHGKRRPGLLPLDQAMHACRATSDSFVWIGLHEPTEDQLQTVASAFGLHPLAVEDALDAHQRPKLERYDDTLFLVLHTVVYVEHERLTATSEIVDTGEIMVFMGARFIVVVRHGPSPGLTGVRRALESRPELLAHGPADVLHAIADTVVDQYLDVVTAVETDVDEAEGDTYRPHQSYDIRRIYQLKRELLQLRRAVVPLTGPMRELAGGRLPGVDKDIATYLRDVHDHLTQAAERITALTEVTDTALSLALTQTGVQQNNDMRRISAIAALIAVPIGIVGVYGMNFDYMPELRWTYGYPLAIGGIIVICAVIYRAFRRNGWL